MRLTQFTDFALRTVLYLGAHPERVVPLQEIAGAYGISYHHLAKVGARLCEIGVTDAVRGRRGGLRLSRTPAEINLGWLVRQTEPDFVLVECFDSETDTCPITSACRLRHVLDDALALFLDVLDGHSLNDFLSTPRQRNQLVQLWRAPL